MLDLDDDIKTAISSDAPLTAILPGGARYMPLKFPVNPTYPMIVFESKQKPSAWSDDVVTAYTCIATIHVMSEDNTNTMMNHVERIMTGIGFSFVDQGSGDEPDCYRDYMVFTITKEV